MLALQALGPLQVAVAGHAARLARHPVDPPVELVLAAALATRAVTVGREVARLVARARPADAPLPAPPLGRAAAAARVQQAARPRRLELAVGALEAGLALAHYGARVASHAARAIVVAHLGARCQGPPAHHV